MGLTRAEYFFMELTQLANLVSKYSFVLFFSYYSIPASGAAHPLKSGTALSLQSGTALPHQVVILFNFYLIGILKSISHTSIWYDWYLGATSNFNARNSMCN